MKPIATAAVTLTTLLLLSGTALAADHEDEMAPESGVDTANETSESMMSSDEAAMGEKPLVEEGGTDSANDLEEEDQMSTVEGGEVAPESGVDSANDADD
ncbi:hypothetical protein [Halomonas nitroreducens]|uniref:Pentapeptide MXKDX repeat protein n=1 Tax=Halomonas nitroreducens TaxID=447425 RepID=A0A431V8K9_9GAMM|nr:hypothetical protein [Halomonas nitroreducens]RTR07010.1 hypothetical protein EKG36_00695 [Halomonas nitroreducens]